MRFGVMAAATAAACVMAVPAEAASIIRVNFSGAGVVTAVSYRGSTFSGVDVGDVTNLSGYVDFGSGLSPRPATDFTGVIRVLTGYTLPPAGPSTYMSLSGDGFSVDAFSANGDYLFARFKDGDLVGFDFRNNDEPVGGQLTHKQFSYGEYDSNTGDTLSFSGTWNISSQTNVISDLPPAVTAPVPEPATWALMILGFGAVGGAMRRKKIPHLSYAGK